MRELGARLAAEVREGDLLVLAGPLGAGKTTLVQGLGRALQVEGEITSPTFVIAREHRGPIRLIHVDAYRLRPDGGGAIDPALALEDLDLQTENAVVVMEWGTGLDRVLATEFLEVRIEILGEDQREVSLTAHGERWSEVVAKW